MWWRTDYFYPQKKLPERYLLAALRTSERQERRRRSWGEHQEVLGSQPMSIEQDLRQRLTAAMKAKDHATANTIRMLKTKVMEKRTAAGFQGEVDDALYLEVIAAYKKSMEKAEKQFLDAGKDGEERAAEIRWEIDFCAQFLPVPLGEQELRIAVKAAVEELGARDVKMTGRVVGAVMKKHKGLVEAALVKSIAEEMLG